MMGMAAQLEMTEGTMIVPPSPTAFWLGLNGASRHFRSHRPGLRVAFERIAHKAGFGFGAGFGIAHTLVAGMFMGMIPMMHPRTPPMNPPGWFMSNLGVSVVAVFMLHFIYGAIVGGMYGPVEHAHAVSPVPNGRERSERTHRHQAFLTAGLYAMTLIAPISS